MTCPTACTAAAKFRRLASGIVSAVSALLINRSERPLIGKERSSARQRAVDFLDENVLLRPAARSRWRRRPSCLCSAEPSARKPLAAMPAASLQPRRRDVGVGIALAPRRLCGPGVFPPVGVTGVEARAGEHRRMRHEALGDEQRGPERDHPSPASSKRVPGSTLRMIANMPPIQDTSGARKNEIESATSSQSLSQWASARERRRSRSRSGMAAG